MFGKQKKEKKPTYVDTRTVKHKTSKLWLWIIWLIILVVSIAYCALSFIAFDKILAVANFDDNGIENRILWAVLAATFIGPFTVCAFFFFGSVLLLRKTMAESGLTYSFGALHWSSIWMAVVVLQSAVALHGQKSTMQKSWAKKNLPWSPGDTSVVTATYVFGYILAIAYLILFVMMFLFRGAAKKLLLNREGEGGPDERPPSNLSSPPSHRASQHTTSRYAASEAAHPEPGTTEHITRPDSDKFGDSTTKHSDAGSTKRSDTGSANVHQHSRQNRPGSTEPVADV